MQSIAFEVFINACVHVIRNYMNFVYSMNVFAFLNSNFGILLTCT